MTTVHDRLRQTGVTYRTMRTYESALKSAGLLDLPADAVTLRLAEAAVASKANVNSRRRLAIAIRRVLGIPVKIPKGVAKFHDLPDEITIRLACSLSRHETRLLLMSHAGLRVSEAAAVTSSQLVAPTKLVVDRQVIESWHSATGKREMAPPKGGKARVVTLPVWLGQRVEGLTEPCAPTGLRNALKDVGEKVGVHLTPHGLRHFYGRTSIRRGMNPVALQRQLGHSSITTTLEVYAQPDDDEISRIWD